jgi:hypothetical protein
MKNWFAKLLTVGALGWLAVLGQSTTVMAADEGPGGSGDRLQRLEQRINQIAERQEQLMRRLEAAGQAQGRPGFQPPPPQWNPRPRNPDSAVRPNLERPRRPLADAALSNPEMAKAHRGLHGLLCLVLLAGMICNILLAIWIFTDIRKRGEGSGIFIALALVAGIPTAIIYALVRIGDRKPV